MMYKNNKSSIQRGISVSRSSKGFCFNFRGLNYASLPFCHVQFNFVSNLSTLICHYGINTGWFMIQVEKDSQLFPDKSSTFSETVANCRDCKGTRFQIVGSQEWTKDIVVSVDIGVSFIWIANQTCIVNLTRQDWIKFHR